MEVIQINREMLINWHEMLKCRLLVCNVIANQLKVRYILETTEFRSIYAISTQNFDSD